MKHLILIATLAAFGCASAPKPAPAKQECRPYPAQPGRVCGEDMTLMPHPAGFVCLCDDMLRRVRVVPESM